MKQDEIYDYWFECLRAAQTKFNGAMPDNVTVLIRLAAVGARTLDLVCGEPLMKKRFLEVYESMGKVPTEKSQ